MTFSKPENEQRNEEEWHKKLNKKKGLNKEAEAEACDIHLKSDEDISPEPGNPDFWPSAELSQDEVWEPPSRNKPDSSPWCEPKKDPQEGEE